MQRKLEQWMNYIGYDELMAGTNNAPHNLLGLHEFGKGQVFTAYRPEAKQIFVTDKNGRKKVELEPVENLGFFGLYVEGSKYKKDYLLHIVYGEDDVVVTHDPYAFDPLISDMDMYLFAEGNHYQIFDKLGAHPMTVDGVEGVSFAVWAPHARSVSVVGNFNMWDDRLHPMRTLEVSGIYELFIPGVPIGSTYKYHITTRSGEVLMKCDPYANAAELRPNNASVVTDLRNYKWQDAKWMKAREKQDRNSCRTKPMAVYEVHIGSWRKNDDGTEDGFYNYRQAADELGEYLLEMGYTHVELMGIAEHPFDGSWGYQVTGYYAPTSRYGSTEDFMYFVDHMHSLGIHVILDWVPAHFPRDAHGLARFDGQPLYEHEDPRRGEHPHWGTYIFDYAKHEVKNFLIANALFWLKKFHIDGLRVDAVASMLYLDYGKNDGEWLANEDGGNENYDAINLFRHLNSIVEREAPGTLMIAEESTAWAGVTAPADLNGLGFLYKWNMGWMNDFLEYMKLDPYFRSFNHNMLTFSFQYACAENYILVLSHDEVVHGKASMIGKMPGEEEDRFANLRAAYGFMYAHPGKKLLFMGQEFAQYREWSEARSLDWDELGKERNQGIQKYIKRLNALYKEYDALYINDYNNMGFEIVNAEKREESILPFIRRGSSAKDQLLFVFNFTPVEHKKYQVGVPCPGEYSLILCSDDVEFGGKGTKNKAKVKAVAGECDGKDYYIEFTLPPLSMVAYRYDYVTPPKKPATGAKRAPRKTRAKK